MKKQKRLQATQSLYEKLISHFERNQQVYFTISMAVSAVMSFLLFDMKVSTGGDDSDYLIFADDFWRHFTFPIFRGPLYPIVISPFVGIFGMRLWLLKSLSAVFIILSMWLLYKSFRGKIPALVLMPSMLLMSICSYVFYYAGQTYSEPMFMFMQSLFFYCFFKYFLIDDSTGHNLKRDWWKYIVIAALVLGITLTRSIGYGIVGVIIMYFIMRLRWKDLLWSIIALGVVFGAFHLFKAAVWPNAGSAYDINKYLAKDFYNVNQGMEDLPGFITRIKDNSLTYLSVILFRFFGFQSETGRLELMPATIRAVTLYVLFAFFIVFLFKRNRALVFAGLYAGIMNFFSFILLQTNWAQDRLIMIYYPLILIFLLGGLCYLLQYGILKHLFFIYPFLLIIVGLATLGATTGRIQKNVPVLLRNIKGDAGYGYTPDWYNFVKGSQWAANNLDKDAGIVSRKPGISRVYTGRRFIGLSLVLTEPFENLYSLESSDSMKLIVAETPRNVVPSPFIRYVIRKKINDDMDTGYTIYATPTEQVDTIVKQLNAMKLKYSFDFKGFIEQGKADYSKIRVYNPDAMLQHLIDANVKYLLLPQLRKFPEKNTGAFIDNIHRYIVFISLKYPNLFNIIHKEGSSEPCEIVEFLYSPKPD
ncbi:MAG: hypothetical protein LBR06_05870 [Bacteroidales bacterium]|jgi:4-amino-4-deoxy-L-arabinose transferase-like glycosyltransferase|nr:hypothetical protein [Bacteroidales bacterium]